MILINSWRFCFETMTATRSPHWRLKRAKKHRYYRLNPKHAVQPPHLYMIEFIAVDGTIKQWSCFYNTWVEFFSAPEQEYNHEVWKAYQDWSFYRELDKRISGPACG